MIKQWVDDHRPSKVSSYVWSSPLLKDKVAEWIAARGIPHLLFSGSHGTGKTTLAYLLLKEMNIPPIDILFINASKERKVDEVMDRITSFCSTWSMNETGFKYVILDEADRLSSYALDALKSEMETNSSSVRFILTANDRNKLTGPLHSRIEEYRFTALNADDFVMRAVEVLESEQVAFEAETLMAFVESTYPDLRKCIGQLQKHTSQGVLQSPSAQSLQGLDYLTDMAAHYRRGEVKAARELVLNRSKVEDYGDIFRFLYQNLDLWGASDDQKDDALLVIRDGMCRHPDAIDPELNLAATFVCLERIRPRA